MATEQRLEVNRLYWETDASVGTIAERLGLSRRALYELLDAAPAQTACPQCGGPLTFSNRLARSTGDAYCAACALSRAVTAEVRRPAEPQPIEPEPQAPTTTSLNGGGNDAAFPVDVQASIGPRRKGTQAALPPLPPYAPPGRLRAEDFAVAAAAGLAAGLLVAVIWGRRNR